ncbi:Mediator of RNA polymerase II transcription subunit 6 [Bienertia sinuspersici]
MSCVFPHTSTTSHHLSTNYRHVTPLKLDHLSPKYYKLKCYGLKKENPSKARSNTSSVTKQKKETEEPENVVLKLAWYASEMLGIAASAFQPPPSDIIDECPDLPCDETGAVDRAAVVETIKQDFQMSYFVTGMLSLSLSL